MNGPTRSTLPSRGHRGSDASLPSEPSRSSARRPVAAERLTPTQRKSIRSQRRKAAIAADPKPREGLLRRRRVGRVTRDRYTLLVENFHRRSGLPWKPLASDLDRILDRELVAVFLAGGEISDARYLLYALQWHHVLTKLHLPLSHASLAGFLRESREAIRDPATWEALLLTVDSMLSEVGPEKEEALEVAVASLLTFDMFSRPSDWLAATPQTLLAPLKGQKGMAGRWAATLFPSTAARRSKTRQQNDTFVIGGSNPRRAWLSRVAAALAQRSKGRKLLLNLSLDRFSAVLRLHQARVNVPDAVPHALRHGGASCDSLNLPSESDVMARGTWGTLKSVARYRKPGRYLRQLARLSPAQRAHASALEPLLADRIVAQLCPSRKRRRC